jgi:hypothetical protein
MKLIEKKRMEKLVECTFDRVIYYCQYVAKINVEQLSAEKLDTKEHFNIRLHSVSQKIAVALFGYEQANKRSFSDIDLITVINEIINKIDLNTNYPSSDSAEFVASFMRFEVNPKLRIISGIKLRRK